MRTCNNCGGADIDVDPARGNAVCTKCGYVLEDNIIVSEVTFTDSNNGGNSVVGQFVSAEGPKSCSIAPGFHHGFGRESREVTLSNGRRRIATVAAALRLNGHHVEAAQQYFKLAVQYNFIQGRKTTHVVAACLYIVCRTEQTPHMLLDFSDVLQVNVYTLGSTFLKLCRTLNIRVPIIDPSLYIFRFAHKLEFGEKTHDVAMTALRLVARMKRDWMQVGRRPAGICGAGLLIAARMFGFSRTQKEIINIVRICDVTLRKRLDEFEDTPSGGLTPHEFQTIDLEEECDPPSFVQARKRARLKASSQQHALPTSAGRDAAAGLRLLTAAGEEAIEAEMRRVLDSDEFRRMDTDAAGATGQSSQALLAAQHAAVLRPPNRGSIAAPASHQDDADNLSDAEDSEVEEMILTADEAQIKAQIWNEMNREYIEEQAEKERLEAVAKEEGTSRAPVERKRKKRRSDRKPADPAENPQQAIRQMLASRKMSKKINYAVLEGLGEGGQEGVLGDGDGDKPPSTNVEDARARAFSRAATPLSMFAPRLDSRIHPDGGEHVRFGKEEVDDSRGAVYEGGDGGNGDGDGADSVHATEECPEDEENLAAVLGYSVNDALQDDDYDDD